MAVPKDGCKRLDPPPSVLDDSINFSSFIESKPGQPGMHYTIYPMPMIGADYDPKKLVWIAMIARYGGCTFEEKVGLFTVVRI